MREIDITPKEFEKILPEICDKKISRYPKYWSSDNPLSGTCVPVSIVARRIFGGQLLRADLRSYPEYRYMYWHWINQLPNGKQIDFTKSQFQEGYPLEMSFCVREESSITRIPNVVYRSKLLYERLYAFLDRTDK